MSLRFRILGSFAIVIALLAGLGAYSLAGAGETLQAHRRHH